MNKNGKITNQPLKSHPVLPKDRLAFVLSHSEVPTLSALARVLKLRRSENLYQVKKGNNNISVQLAKRITEVYPQFNEGWLTTGVGEPFRELIPAAPSHTKQLPLYTVLDFFPDGTLCETDKMLTFPADFCPSAQLVTVCRDDAMGPRVMPGDYLFLVPSTIEAIVFGHVYFIVTASVQICRIIRKSEKQEHLRLVSLKPERYDEIILSQEYIRALYRVCGIFQHLGG